MRRDPLTNRPTGLAGAVLLAVLLVGCTATPTEPPGSVAVVDVAIATASGDRLAFEPAETAVAGPGPVAITFRNDSTLPHNMVFTAGLTAATRTIVAPGTSERLVVVLPAPGTYSFVCTIHDGMAGSLIVGTRSGAVRGGD